ncbi:MAG: sensor histidine kinase [Solirubrobacteraceae bacterium]
MPDRLLDPLVALAVAGVALLELQLPSMTDDARAPVVVILFCAPVAIRRWAPLVALLGLTAAGALSPTFADGFPSTPHVATALVFYSVAAQSRSRFALAAGAASFLALEATIGIHEDAVVPLVIGAWGSYWIGRQVRARRETVEVLALRAGEIEAAEDAFRRLSVRRERARIARELHDIVSHHLAMIVVQAGAGRMATSGGPERALTRFSAIHAGAEQALSEIARLVEVVGADAAVRPDRLRLLLDQAIARGLALHVTGVPPPVRLPVDVDVTAYRVVREGLTNAVKHAPGSEIQLRLAVDDGTLEIELRDSGGGCSALATTGSGLGLVGMRERVERLGGELEAGPGPGGGWVLRARLALGAPITAATVASTPTG